MVLRATVVREPAVHFVHPTRFVAAIELVEVVDALHIIGTVAGGVGVFELQPRRRGRGLQNVEHRVALREANCGSCQDHAVGRHTGAFARSQIAHVVEDGVATHLNRAGLRGDVAFDCRGALRRSFGWGLASCRFRA